MEKWSKILLEEWRKYHWSRILPLLVLVPVVILAFLLLDLSGGATIVRGLALQLSTATTDRFIAPAGTIQSDTSADQSVEVTVADNTSDILTFLPSLQSSAKSTSQKGEGINEIDIPLVVYSRPQAPLLKAEEWQTWPLLPVVSANAREIYRKGLEKGNNPHAVSIVGDCQSMPDKFMGVYDQEGFQLAPGEQGLQETITQFSGSFKRYSPTIIDAANAATMIWSGWANVSLCGYSNTPIECELSIHKPSIVMINLGTHSSARNSQYIRQIINTIIEHGAIPVLSTKADNLEKNFSINEDLARASLEYDIPLWNFWASVQDLPDGGLDRVKQGGGMYLTPEGLERHRLNALKALDAVWRALR